MSRQGARRKKDNKKAARMTSEQYMVLTPKQSMERMRAKAKTNPSERDVEHNP